MISKHNNSSSHKLYFHDQMSKIIVNLVSKKVKTTTNPLDN